MYPICSGSYAPTYTHASHTYTFTIMRTHAPTHAVQDLAATSIQSGAGQDDYNPFIDEGAKEKELEKELE